MALQCAEVKFVIIGEPKVTKYRGKIANTVKNFEILKSCATYGDFVAAYERRGRTRAEAWGMVDWAERRGLIKFK